MKTKRYTIEILLLITMLNILQIKKISAQEKDTALNQKLTILTHTSEVLNQISDTIKILNSSSTTLQEEIKDLENKKNKSESDINKLEKKKNTLIKITAQLSEKIDDLVKQKNQLEESTENLKADITSLSITQTKLKKDSADLSVAKDSLSKDTIALSKKKADFEKEIEKRKATISKQLDSLEVIGKLEMLDSVKVLEEVAGKSDPTLFRTKVNKIHISVREGIILEIIVTTDSGTFRNKNAIIDLLHFGNRGSDKLRLENQRFRPNGANMYVFLDDVLMYSPLRSYTDVPYAEFDITLLPTDESRSYLLRESTSINTYFNVAAFTDLKGINGEANGLAQFTAEAKFITRTKNFKESSVVPFNYISFRAGLSKFDNDFKGTKLYKEDSVSRRDLLQRSTYYVGIKLNLLRGFPSTYPHHLLNDIQLNVGVNFIGTKVYDTLFKDQANTIIDTAFKNVTQNQLFLEPSFSFNRHKNFSMTLSVPFLFNNIKKSGGISNNSTEYWICPSINLMYYGKRDAGSKIFFRYNHYVNLKDNTQAFSQMQLGYSVNLTEVWSGSSEKN